MAPLSTQNGWNYVKFTNIAEFVMLNEIARNLLKCGQGTKKCI